MAPLDTAAWLAAVSEDAPAGPDLEFDPDFAALERAAAGKPEAQYGDTIIPAEPPDWKEVAALAAGLLERTRDLRVLTHLAVARLQLDDLSGLLAYSETLAVARGLLETRWAELHPRLDPEDDNDPTLRGNALLRLAHPGLVLRRLRDLPLGVSPRLGRISMREIAAATSAEEPEPGQVRESLIFSVFQDTDARHLGALRTAAATAAGDATAIVTAFEEAAGPATGPDFDPLVKLLREMTRAIDRFGVPAEDHAADAQPIDAGRESEAVSSGLPPTAEKRSGTAAAGPARFAEVTTRAEAIRLLDLVCQYYRRHEPSSPLPLLIERARRLADKDFLEILRDLAPEGLSQARLIAGSTDE